jgi:hypothetical protein
MGALAETFSVVVSARCPNTSSPFVAHDLPLFDTETEAIAALSTFLGACRRLAVARPPAPV